MYAFKKNYGRYSSYRSNNVQSRFSFNKANIHSRQNSGGIRKHKFGDPSIYKLNNVRNLPCTAFLNAIKSETSASSANSTKIIISNLDFGVNDKDIRDLFQEFGAIKSSAVHYDKDGRSLGIAEVDFEKHENAIKAIDKYQNVKLDNRVMVIKIASEQHTGLSSRAVQINRVCNDTARPIGTVQRHGCDDRQNNARNKIKTETELDAELELYAKKTTEVKMDTQ